MKIINYFIGLLFFVSSAHAQIFPGPSSGGAGCGANCTGAQLISTATTGTAPIVVSSTTPVSNLNIAGNAATATTCGTATNFAPISYTFATLPAAASVTSYQPYQVTDVGTTGSVWYSNGSIWSPVNGSANIFNYTYPFIYPSSGILTVTTGVLTLTTALDAVYANSYMYFPAGTWTSSTAGWYYTTCTTTTSCLVYSNAYTSGIPTTPGSPALVTTGAGAYVQTTGSYINALSFTVPGNLIGLAGQLYLNFTTTNNTTAGAKFIRLSYGGQALAGITRSTFTGDANRFYIQNRLATNVQTTVSEGPSAGSNAFLTVDSTTSQTLLVGVYLTTATDFIIVQGGNEQLIR